MKDEEHYIELIANSLMNKYIELNELNASEKSNSKFRKEFREFSELLVKFNEKTEGFVNKYDPDGVLMNSITWPRINDISNVDNR